MAVLRGEEPDRVPIWMLFPRETYSSYADVYSEPSYRRVAPYVRQHTDFFDRRNVGAAPFYTTAARVQTLVRDEGDERVTEDRLETPLGRLTRVRRSWPGSHLRWHEQEFVSSLEDLDRILSIPYEPPEPDLTDFLAASARLGDDGLMMVSVAIPFGILYSVCDPGQFALWTATDPEPLVAFIEEMHQRSQAWLHRVLHKGGGPTFFVCDTEMAAPPLLSPAQFESLAGRTGREQIGMMHDHGAYAIVHHHGRVKALLETIADLGADAIHPIEEPPVGDCWLAEAKRRIGDRVCLIGSIQYDDLARLPPDELEELVRRQIADAAAEGRYILSSTAGPYEAEISPGMQDNYIRMVDAGLRWGTYPPRV